MVDKKKEFLNVPNTLLILWCLAKIGYDVCFAFKVVHWDGFGAVAVASTFVMLLYSKTDAARRYERNPFMLRHKQWMLPGFFATLLTIIVIEYILKGTPYQIEFLGLLLAAANLFVIGIIIFGGRHPTDSHNYR